MNDHSQKIIPRADFVVIEENGIVDMGLKIFSIFRRYNILEFKNPIDDLSEAVLWNVIGYAGFYISKFQVPAEEVTLTLFRGAKPVKLFHEMQDFIEPDETKGIYHIKGWMISIPIQIVVTTELEGDEYAGFRAISRKPRLEDVRHILSEVLSESNADVVGWYRDYLDLFSKLDNEMMEDVKRRYPEMARTWRDIFGVDDEINSAAANNTRINLFTYVQDGAMTIDYAARQANLSAADFAESMRNAGFAVPQRTLV